MEYGMERILPPCGTNRNKKINIMDTNKKKWTSRLWNVLLGTALLGSMLTSCVDDEFPSMHGTTPLTRSIGASIG